MRTWEDGLYIEKVSAFITVIFLIYLSNHFVIFKGFPTISFNDAITSNDRIEFLPHYKSYK